MVYLALIHPYGDGNGRLSRLLEFAILLRAGVPDIAAHLLSNLYNETRARYYQELQETHGDMIDGAYPPYIQWHGFLEYALEGYCDSLAEQCPSDPGAVGQCGSGTTIFTAAFPKQMTIQQQRRKQLALSLTEMDREQTVGGIPSAYADRFAGKRLCECWRQNGEARLERAGRYGIAGSTSALAIGRIPKFCSRFSPMSGQASNRRAKEASHRLENPTPPPDPLPEASGRGSNA